MSPEEQKRIKLMGFELLKRCKACRKARRVVKKVVADELASYEM